MNKKLALYGFIRLLASGAVRALAITRSSEAQCQGMMPVDTTS